MASPNIIDLDSLLTPISEEVPTGPDIRDDPSASSPYQTIKSARTQARAAERQGILDTTNNDAAVHWRNILTLAPTIIAEQSKDLVIACWYSEAMIRQYGFAGLRDAMALIRGLVDNFWEGLHPMPDEYGMETRVSCLDGLSGSDADGVLIAPIRKVELTEGDDPGPYSLWQYRQALDANKIADDEARSRKVKSLGFGIDDIERSVENSSETFYANLYDDLNQIIEDYRAVGLKLDELCGLDDSPSTRRAVEALEECFGAVKHIAKEKLPSADEEDSEEAEAGEAESADGEAAPVKKKKKTVGGPIETREDAFKMLIEIAKYFRKTEPHSPVSYVLQKAVKWGDMPLGELISELIIQDESRKRFSELTGVEYEQSGE